MYLKCCIIFILLVTCIALVTPSPIPTGADKIEFYFPTQLGTKWVYQDGESELTQTITNVEKKTDFIYVTLGRVSKSGTVTPLEKICVSSKGLTRSRLKPAKTDVPVILLKLPVKVDEEWKYELPGDGFNFKSLENGTMKVYGSEDIKVPAGTFTAVRVIADASVLNGTVLKLPCLTTFWYAKGVGLVKKIDYDENVIVLKSFDPGK